MTRIRPFIFMAAAFAVVSCAKGTEETGGDDPGASVAEPVVSIGPASVELDGNYQATFKVTLSWSYVRDITVNLKADTPASSAADGFVAIPDDALSFEHTVTIPAGTQEVEQTVSIVDDDLPHDLYETRISIAGVSEGTVSKYNASTRIFGQVGFDPPVVSITAGEVLDEWFSTTMTVSLSNAFNRDVEVAIRYTPADEGTSFHSFPAGRLQFKTPVVIPAGETEVTETVCVPDTTGMERFYYYQTNLVIDKVSHGKVDPDHGSAYVKGWIGNFIHPKLREDWKVSYLGKRETPDHYCIDYFRIEGVEGGWAALADFTDEELEDRFGGRLGAVMETYDNYLDFAMNFSHRKLEQLCFNTSGDVAYGRLEGGKKEHMLLLQVTDEGHVTGEYAECTFTSDQPFGVSTYTPWLGQWTVTPSAVEPETAAAKTFDIIISEGVVNSSYSISGWQQMNAEMPISASFDLATGSLVFVHQTLGEVYNAYGTYNMFFTALVRDEAEGGKRYFLNFSGGTSIATAVLSGDGDTATLTGRTGLTFGGMTGHVELMSYYTEATDATSHANATPTGSLYILPATLTRVGTGRAPSAPRQMGAYTPGPLRATDWQTFLESQK